MRPIVLWTILIPFFFRDRLSRFLSRTQQTPGGKRDGISRGDREGRVWAVDEDADREGAESKKKQPQQVASIKMVGAEGFEPITPTHPLAS